MRRFGRQNQLMKAVFIHNQLEYRLETRSDELHQGDSLPCTLNLKNHGSDVQTVTGLSLGLASADLKKAKDKNPEAYSRHATSTWPAELQVPAGAQLSQSWTFEQDRNCLVSDKAHSLCLLFGSQESGPQGQGQLSVSPHPHIQQILAILDSSCQFGLKGLKSSDDWVQAKLKAPAERRFSFVEELWLHCRFEGDALQLKYVFKVKKLDASAGNVSVRKGKTEVLQSLETARYLLTPEHINHDVVEAAIEEAISVVASGI